MSQERLKCAYDLCDRKPLENSKDGYCIFHAEGKDKDEKEFRSSFAGYIMTILEGSSLGRIEAQFNFRGFVFAGGIHFKRDFRASVFENADFEKAEFLGHANFKGMRFSGETNFRLAKFHKDVNFEGIGFEGDTSFWQTKFQGGADFEKALFRRKVSFRKASFRQEAYFLNAQFEGTANFKEAKFYGEAAFSGAEFWEYTSFDNAEVGKGLDLGGVEFHKRASISPKFIKGKALFIAAVLDNISLSPLNLDKDASIDFTNARLRNTEIKQEDVKDHIIQEREENFFKAKEIYLALKSNFHGLGRYDDESWAFKKEKDMERKNYFHARWLRWFGSMFWNLLYGYGERPFRIFGWCGFLLLSSSFVYWFSKGVFHVIGTDLVLVEDYWNNLYFSIVTFTTLGYGDFRPIGTVKILASVEALLGIFLIALFIFALARKTGGR